MTRTRSRLLDVASVVAMLFGLATIRSGAVTLFDPEAAARAGNYIAFVLWFNFAAGFAYVAAAIGLWLRRRWAAWLAVGLVVATALVFAALGLRIALGSQYEMRTVWAMTLRTLVWGAIALLGCRVIGCFALPRR